MDIDILKATIEQAKDMEKTTTKLPDAKRRTMITRITEAEKFVAHVEAGTFEGDANEWAEVLSGRLDSSIDSCYHYASYVGD